MLHVHAHVPLVYVSRTLNGSGNLHATISKPTGQCGNIFISFGLGDLARRTRSIREPPTTPSSCCALEDSSWPHHGSYQRDSFFSTSAGDDQ